MYSFAQLCNLIFYQKKSLNFAKSGKSSNFSENVANMFEKLANKLANIDKIETAELCKGVHCVDLGESLQTHIYSQNLASIQPRTSSLKFARSTDPFKAVYHTAKNRSVHRGPAGCLTSVRREFLSAFTLSTLTRFDAPLVTVAGPPAPRDCLAIEVEGRPASCAGWHR